MMSLQKALHTLVQDSKHPAKKIAEEGGISYGYLMKAADELQPEVQLQARVVPGITKASERDDVIEFLAIECGGVFVRLAPHQSHDAHTAKTLKEVGEYISKIAEASVGGINASELPGIEAEANDVIQSILAHLGKLKSEAK